MSRQRSNVPGSASLAEQEDKRWAALACPACHGGLVWSSSESHCEACARRFDVVDGIPILLAPDMDARTRSPSNGKGTAAAALEDASQYLPRLPAAEQKLRQAQFFDKENAELEISRPYGQPVFYGWLLSEKLRRSLQGVGSVRDISAVTVCGGSGMDAEFLARQGASVTSIDISLGAAVRARERARRYAVSITAVVADAERLPLRDQVVDLAYVHDGLHHLADPYAGVREMARVSRRAVSLTEPARAAVTRIAVRLGAAVDHEEAGNHVGRMDLAEIDAMLASSGFGVVYAERYAMYYHQLPGTPMRFSSRRRVFPLAVLGIRAANRVAGSLGNKLTVQALRS